MACDIDDREGESPSPMEPRLGRMFHSSATGRRLEQLFLRRSVFVKRFNHEMTLREVSAVKAAGAQLVPMWRRTGRKPGSRQSATAYADVCRPAGRRLNQLRLDRGQA
jgi:hypothetical protein